jgi:hypothetical protein
MSPDLESKARALTLPAVNRNSTAPLREFPRVLLRISCDGSFRIMGNLRVHPIVETFESLLLR